MPILNFSLTLLLLLTATLFWITQIKLEKTYNSSFSIGFKSFIFYVAYSIFIFYFASSIFIAVFIILFPHFLLHLILNIYFYLSTRSFFKHYKDTSSLAEIETQIIEEFLKLNFKCYFIIYKRPKNDILKHEQISLKTFQYKNNNGITFIIQLGEDFISPFNKKAEFLCSSTLDRKIIYLSDHLYQKSFYIISDGSRIISISPDEFETICIHIDDYTKETIDLLEMNKI